jgi:hypothetical protein
MCWCIRMITVTLHGTNNRNYSDGSTGLSCSVPVDYNSSHGFCGKFDYTHVTHSTDKKFSESDNMIEDKSCKYIKSTKIQNIQQKVL